MVGECTFDFVVKPKPSKNYIDLDGESPRVVKDGECQTLKVRTTYWIKLFPIASKTVITSFINLS